jgi:hypothetical protein
MCSSIILDLITAPFLGLLASSRHFQVFRGATNVHRQLGNVINLLLFFRIIEALSLTLREEHRLRVFENRILRRVFGPQRDKVTGAWRKLHNEELHSLYSS